jgi:hydrogenase nickel incorporation protein HypA/HybF
MSSLFNIIQEKAVEENAKRIVSITIRVGALSGIEPDLLTFAFDFFAKDTNAEGARFIVNKTEMSGRCKSCGNTEFTFEKFALSCPKCGSFEIQIDGDDQLMIEKMEVELENH